MDTRLLFITVLLATLLVAGCTGSDLESSGESRAVFTITDEAADMGAVSSLRVTVDRVRVHSETEGWVTVSSSPQTYDLLELKASGTQQVLADAELEEGTYTKLWLDVSNAVVTDNDGEHEATLPSNTLRMQGQFTAEANKTATATFDFVADRSLHVTGNGEYILAPVVKVETREDAQVDIGTDNSVSVNGGSVRTNVEVGMDEDGNVGVGLEIPATTDLQVDAAGAVTFGSSSDSDTQAGGSTSGSVESGNGSTSAEANGSITVN